MSRIFLKCLLNTREIWIIRTGIVRYKATLDRESIQCFRTSVKARDYDVYSCYSTVDTKKTKKEGIINA
jgi:hypothetical protein